MTDPNEVELLIAAQAGDVDAFEDLQIILEPPLLRYVRRMTGAVGVEEDIVQEVFLSLYLNLRVIDPPENLRPYVFRMARNRCYDEFRRWGRQETVSLDDEPVQIWVSFHTQDDHARPDDLTHWMLLYLEVQEAIDSLPEVQRETLILFSEEHLSYAEIAEVMNTNIGTVKSRLFHAKQNLRRLLHPETIRAIEEDE